MATIGSVTASDITRVLGRSAASQAAGSAATPSSREEPTAGTAATAIDLSDRARALLAQLNAGKAVLDGIPNSFDDLVKRKSEEVTAKLTRVFEKAGIPLDEAIELRFTASGKVVTSSPYKEKIEKVFEENPDLAEELKTVDTLNTLKATLEALRLYDEEKKRAHSDEERDEASDRYIMRSMTIQSLSGVLTLEDGKLTSAAVDYAMELSGPTAPGASPEDPKTA